MPEDLPMNRREFLRKGIDKVCEVTVEHAEEQIKRHASHWIRPPYALDELEFMLACTRCGECIDACPHNAIFPLAARLGAQFVGTPALDLTNRSCHLCEDWPCVAVCEPGALKRPEADENGVIPLPRIAFAMIDEQSCLPYLGPECSACNDACPVPGAMVWENEKPTISPDSCVGCGLCREACILEPKAIPMRSKWSTS